MVVSENTLRILESIKRGCGETKYTQSCGPRISPLGPCKFSQILRVNHFSPGPISSFLVHFVRRECKVQMISICICRGD